MSVGYSSRDAEASTSSSNKGVVEQAVHFMLRTTLSSGPLTVAVLA